MNLHQIGLFPNVVQEINVNKDVKDFVCSSVYFADLVDALNNFLPMSVVQPTKRVLQQSYVKKYTRPPIGCRSWLDNNGVHHDTPTLIFAPLQKNGKAFGHTRIAHLPLLPNINSIAVYFPSSIITNASLFRIEKCTFSRWYNFAILEEKDVANFIKAPANFLDISKVIKQINYK